MNIFYVFFAMIYQNFIYGQYITSHHTVHMTRVCWVEVHTSHKHANDYVTERNDVWWRPLATSHHHNVAREWKINWHNVKEGHIMMYGGIYDQLQGYAFLTCQAPDATDMCRLGRSVTLTVPSAQDLWMDFLVI